MNRVSYDNNTVIGKMRPDEKAKLIKWCEDNGHFMGWAVMQAVREFLQKRGVKI